MFFLFRFFFVLYLSQKCIITIRSIQNTQKSRQGHFIKSTYVKLDRQLETFYHDHQRSFEPLTFIIPLTAIQSHRQIPIFQNGLVPMPIKQEQLNHKSHKILRHEEQPETETIRESRLKTDTTQHHRTNHKIKQHNRIYDRIQIIRIFPNIPMMVDTIHQLSMLDLIRKNQIFVQTTFRNVVQIQLQYLQLANGMDHHGNYEHVPNSVVSSSNQTGDCVEGISDQIIGIFVFVERKPGTENHGSFSCPVFCAVFVEFVVDR